MSPSQGPSETSPVLPRCGRPSLSETPRLINQCVTSGKFIRFFIGFNFIYVARLDCLDFVRHALVSDCPVLIVA